MKTIRQKQENNGEKHPKRSAFWEFMGGDFLLHQKVMQFYPYLLFLFLLAALIVFNEKRINDKEKKIKQLSEEYKQTVSELKEHNQFITYDSNKRIINMLEERGFQKNDKNLYKIPITINEEH